MSQLSDSPAHTTVSVLGPRGHGAAATLAAIGDALAKQPGARVHRARERLRCDLPARSIELLAPPPDDAPLEALTRAAVGADVTLLVVAPQPRDDAELSRLLRVTQAFRGAPALVLRARDDDDDETLDRLELELRAIVTDHGLDGDTIPCTRARGPDDLARLAGHLLHDTRIRPPGAERLTIAELLDSRREPDWHPDELELWVYLAQGSVGVGDALVLTRPNVICECAVTAVDPELPELPARARVGAPRHARLRVRFHHGPPYPDTLRDYIALDAETARLRPWSQVFELNMTYFERAPPYPGPLSKDHAVELALASGRRRLLHIMGVDGGEDYGGRYAWRVRAESAQPLILARGTRFLCVEPAPERPEALRAMGVVRRALPEQPRVLPPYDLWDDQGDDLLGDIFCD